MEARMDTDSAAHTVASDCHVDPETGLCRECGVDHSEPCPACEQAGFHAAGCPVLA